MILYYLFIFLVVVQCGYALYFFTRVFSMPQSAQLPVSERQPVSIIICAKNEAANLKENLPTILSQRYSNDRDSHHDGAALYEVIVVNDGSDDNTPQVLMEMEQWYGNLWDVVIPSDATRDLKGKKYALSKGVESASYDWLVLIDADCVPASHDWLEKMVAPLAKGKEIVAGYGGYHTGSGLLNAFVQWETMHTFLQYSTYALAGMPYMAVGRNMAFTRQAFQQAISSPKWNALPSGDDDLLVSIVGNGENTAIVCDKEAFTTTNAKTTWAEWRKQKRRHLSTGKYYKPGIKFLLGLYGASHAGLWLCFLSCLFFSHPLSATIFMCVRCIIYWVLWTVIAGKLGRKRLIYFFPLFDIGWMVYNFAFFPYITHKDEKNWK